MRYDSNAEAELEIHLANERMNISHKKSCLICKEKESWPTIETRPQTLAITGWLCPACGRGNAPTTPTCLCKGYPPLVATC